MDTTAVSLSEIVSKKHNIKWRDYHLLKSIIRNAYLSEDLSYSLKINTIKLSMFRFMRVDSEHLTIDVHYSRIEESFILICIIK